MSPVEAKLAELAVRFAARASGERAALAAAVAASDRDAIVERAHKLAGIAGMFGHEAIGAAAFSLEEAARRGTAYSTEADVLLGELDKL